MSITPENEPDDWVAVTTSPLEITFANKHLSDPATGAQVIFAGTVREFTQPGNTGFHPSLSVSGSGESTAIHTLALHYDAYPKMAESEMRKLLLESRQRWPLHRQLLLHRIGRLDLAEIAILIGVSSAHRKAAFAAAQFLIDHVKQRVPIWKKEILASGQTQWIHPINPE